MNAELDHVFVFVADLEIAGQALSKKGLIETYRRLHPGQGTSNICYAFENAFLELLNLHDQTEALSSAVVRCQFDKRGSAQAAAQTNPFGIAWRGSILTPTWAFEPPYLPPGVAISVATDSDRLNQPFLFTFPGSTAPNDWNSDRQGALQRSSGFTRLTLEAVVLGRSTVPGETILELQRQKVLSQITTAPHSDLVLALDRSNGPPLHLSLRELVLC